MDANKIAKDNHMFYYVAVGQRMCDGDFTSATQESFFEPAQCSIEGDNFSGYIRIDSTNIIKPDSKGSERESLRKSFMSAVHQGICGSVAMRIPRSITGEMNTEAVVTHGIYKFSFKISKYERDSDHDFEEVKDPLPLPDGERLGRFVDLKITIVQ